MRTYSATSRIAGFRRRRSIPRVVRLEDRTAPSAAVLSPKALLRQPGEQPVSLVQPPPLPQGPAPSSPWAPPAFDAVTGRALPGNQSRVSDPLLRLYNGLVVDRVLPADELLQVSETGQVAVHITGYNVTTLEPALNALGYRKYADRPEYHLTEGTLPVTSLPAAEALWVQGLLGITPIRRPQTGLGLVTSQADWAMESDRTRLSEPYFATGNTVRVGILSDSFATRVAPITTAAQDIANGDLPAAGVKVWQEGPAASSDEGRAMLQLVHDVATGSPLSFASAFFGQADFADQIKILADPAQGNCQVIADDIFYFEEPMYQDGLIAQAIDDVVINDDVAYFALGGNHANTGYENIGWTENDADPFNTNLFDFDPGAGVDSRQRVTIANGGFARIVFQWDDPHFTGAGVNTNMDIFLIRSDTGATVASAVDNNIATQVPSELLTFTNATGQTNFDVIIRRNSGPNPGRFKYVHLGNGSPITINQFFDADVATQTPHSAAVWAEGVGAIAYSERPNPEAFTSQGGNVILFDAAGNPIAPQTRSLDVAGIDDVDTSFFGGDSDGNGFPNFSGTSAATPNVAAVAALLLDANPTFLPSSIYSRLESRAEDVHLPGIDNKTGSGLVNAYDAVIGFATYDETNVIDGFESGFLDRRWQTRSTGAGRIEVSSDNTPAAGTFHVTLDSDLNGVDSRNELILRVNLANVGNSVLSFKQKEFADEDNVMPPTFSGSGDFDGVAMSVNGTDWFTLVSLTGTNSTATYQTFTFNLNKFAADNAIALDSTVQIKFQQFDNFGIGFGDGMTFDDISVTRTGLITGLSYDDANANGKVDGGELPRVGSTVYADANGNNQFDWGNAVTYTSAQLPAAIRDNDIIRVPLTVAGIGGNISDADVSLDLTHTFDADLDIVLIAPDGTRVTLSSDNGGAGDNYTNTTFDDEAATDISAGAAPFTGRFQPEGSLSAVDGLSLSGTWYLEIVDDLGGDSGTLNSWSLTLSRAFNSVDVPKALPDDTTVNSTLSVAGLAGVISDIDVTIDITHPWTSDLDVFLTGPGGVKVELTTDNNPDGDNYTNTTFDDEAATAITAGAAPFTGRFRPEGSLAAFDGLSPNTNWTLSVSDDLAGFTGTLNSWSLTVGRDFAQDIAPIAVPDPGSKTATLEVAHLTGPIVDLEVNLNLTQTWNSDFDVVLISPTGTKVALFDDVGGSSDNFTGLVLDDAALVPIQNGLGPFTGPFRPEGLLSALNGEDANGTWSLQVTDDLVGFAGTIVDWSLTLHTAATAANTTKLNIADQATMSSVVALSGITGAVNDINVTLDITHTFTADLNVFLIGPGGARVELVTDAGGGGDNFTNTTFDDEAATSITGATPPFTGTFRPEGSLALFDGINPNGFWFLEIFDDLGGDTGTLNSWSITVTTGEIHSITNASGVYSLTNLDADLYTVREVLPPGRYHTEPAADEYSINVTNAIPAFINVDFGSDADPTGPSVTITPVSPDPRNTAVNTMQIVFTENVQGFDIGDLELTRDFGSNLLTGAQTLTTVDNTTFTLNNLAGITAAGGNYRLAYNGQGSGVVDRALNAYTGFTFEDWTVDTTAPTASAVTRADANPTAAPNVTWNVTFSEPVVNLAAANFNLVNVGLGGAPAITGVAGGGANWTVTASTGTGIGTLGLNLANVGTLTDTAGNPISGLPFVGEVYNVAHTPPKILPLVINAGAAQRSRVTSIEVDFDQLVTLPGAPATAFLLRRQSDGAVVNLSAAVSDIGTTKVMLTFTGGAVDANSLADGRYTLTAFAASIAGPAGALDGDGNGTGGDNYVLVGDPTTNKLHRVFGDSDGDGDVDATDFGAFRAAFGSANNTFDFENDGDVDATDFGQFRVRFGSSV